MNLKNLGLSPRWLLAPRDEKNQFTPAGYAAYQAWLARARAEADELRARAASPDEFLALSEHQRDRDRAELEASFEVEADERRRRAAAIEAARRSPEMKAAAAKARAEAIAIVNECHNAGFPELAKGFVDTFTPLTEVRKRLAEHAKIDALHASPAGHA